MIDKSTIWNHSIEAMNALSPYYKPQVRETMLRARARPSWLPLLRTAGSEPLSMPAGRVAVLAPYTAAGRRQQLLDDALARGLLSAEQPGWFRLTDQGREVVSAFFEQARTAIAAAPSLAGCEMDRLAGLLQRIVQAAERLPLPQNKTHLVSSRSTDPGADAPPNVRVDQYLTDLMHFRADAHYASWRSYGVDGRSWEALTYIWRDEANTAADLAARLAQRGYSEDDYAQAVQLLLHKGWIEQAAGRWQMTAGGRAVRDVSEMVTDRLFFAPWDTLDGDELTYLNTLLVKLAARLREAAPAQLATA